MRTAPQHLRTFMVTCTTANRRRLFQVTENADLLLDTLQTYRLQGRYSLHGFVIMPDHLHLLLTPAPDVSLEKAMQYIKGGFSYRLKASSTFGRRVVSTKGLLMRTATRRRCDTSMRILSARTS